MNKLPRIIGLTLGVAGLAGDGAICAAPPKPSVASIPGAPAADATRPLVRIYVADNPVDIPSGVKASITFGPDGVVSGYSGVNSFSGKYAAGSGKIQWMSPFLSTRKGGSPAAMEFERRFLEVLQGCTKIEESDQTVLSGAAGKLVFAVPAVQR